MGRLFILIGIAILTGGVITGLSINVSAEEFLFPPWIKNTAEFWIDDQISDAEFLSALQYLVKEGILVIPDESEPVIKTETVTKKVLSNISRIDNFYVLGNPEDDKYVIRYTLMSPNQVQISEDGTVSITIFDDTEEILYSNEFSVKKNNFGKFNLVLTGQEFLAHAWEISTSDLKKGIGMFGTATLVFTDINGKKFTSETSVNIPQLSNTELTSKSQTDFLKTATPINLILENDGLEIELKSGGMFTHLQYDTWGDKVNDYRIDIVIKNKSNESITFSPFGSFIQTNDERQFDSNTFGTIEYGKILSGSTIEGYILFDVDDNLGKIKSIIINDYIFDLENNQAYTFEEMREKEYENNSINIGKSIDRGSFEITLVKVGKYSKTNYSKTVDGFRADFIIENVWQEAGYIPVDIVLLDGNGNQFDKSYHSEIEYKKIQPGIKYAGYAFFEDYYGDSSKATIIITKSDYPNDYVWSWDVSLVK